MTPNEFATRVTLETVWGVAALTLVAAWFAGPAAGLGVVSGGLLTVVNFRQLVARVLAVSADRRQGRGWLVGVGMRFVILASLAAALMASGWADPIGFVLGLSVLPCALIGDGLYTARRMS